LAGGDFVYSAPDLFFAENLAADRGLDQRIFGHSRMLGCAAHFAASSNTRAITPLMTDFGARFRKVNVRSVGVRRILSARANCSAVDCLVFIVEDTATAAGLGLPEPKHGQRGDGYMSYPAYPSMQGYFG
jgi:hypothetical protein